MEDDRVAILEAQLSQAKLIAEEADKKYEEVVTLISITWWIKRNWLGKKKMFDSLRRAKEKKNCFTGGAG